MTKTYITSRCRKVSFYFPHELDSEVGKTAEATGQTRTEVIISAIRQALGLPATQESNQEPVTA